MILNFPRIIIAAAGSTAGKTTITCGILRALKNRNIKACPFKIGPDYIDPMIHKIASGEKSRNLDLLLMGRNGIFNSLYNFGAKSDISIIEGVMGYYDGIGTTSDASAADIGNITQTPCVLVFNPNGMAVSCAAALKGFLEFRQNTVRAVILNNIKPSILNYYKNIIENELGLEVLGCLPFDEEISFKSRHLGLIADETESIDKKINKAAQLCSEYIDTDRLLEIAKTAGKPEFEKIYIKNILSRKVKIAAAYDNAFCFYYEDNLEILRKMGAELEFFSPIADKKLPDNISGIYIGGGYPELYLKELSENIFIKDAIRSSVKAGMPIIAECGGFMYLQESIEYKLKKYDMCKIIKGRCRMSDRLSNFGYFKLKANTDNMLFKKDCEVNAHEFHYSESDNNGSCFTAEKIGSGKKRNCIFADNNIFAGYPHVNFYGCLNAAHNFLKACERWGLSEN